MLHYAAGYGHMAVLQDWDLEPKMHVQWEWDHLGFGEYQDASRVTYDFCRLTCRSS